MMLTHNMCCLYLYEFPAAQENNCFTLNKNMWSRWYVCDSHTYMCVFVCSGMRDISIIITVYVYERVYMGSMNMEYKRFRVCLYVLASGCAVGRPSSLTPRADRANRCITLTHKHTHWCSPQHTHKNTHTYLYTCLALIHSNNNNNVISSHSQLCMCFVLDFGEILWCGLWCGIV